MKKTYTKSQVSKAFHQGVKTGEKRVRVVEKAVYAGLPLDHWMKTKKLKRLYTDGLTTLVEVKGSLYE